MSSENNNDVDEMYNVFASAALKASSDTHFTDDNMWSMAATSNSSTSTCGEFIFTEKEIEESPIDIRDKLKTLAKLLTADEWKPAKRPRHNGATSTTRGPCACGYKHWVDNVEYDLCISFQVGSNRVELGYNLDQNEYVVAQQFVDRHFGVDASNPWSSNASVVQNVIKEIQKERARCTGAAPRTPVSGGALPSTTAASMPSATAATPSIDTDEVERRRRRADEARRREREEKRADRAAKERIKEQIKQDRLDRKRREEAERAAAPSGAIAATAVPTSSAAGGIMTINDVSPSSLSSKRGTQSSLKRDELTAEMLDRIYEEEGEIELRHRMQAAGFSKNDIDAYRESMLLRLAMRRLEAKGAGFDRLFGGGALRGPDKKKQAATFRLGESKGFKLGTADDSGAASGVVSMETDETPATRDHTEIGGGSASVPQADDTAPTTRIRVRLLDGTRRTLTLNHTHTIADIRLVLDADNSVISVRSYALMCQHPRRVFDDENVTLSDAGLLNAALTQVKK